MGGEISISLIGIAGIIVGAIIGAFGLIYTTGLRLKGREDYFDDKAKKFLELKFKSSDAVLSWDDLSKYGEAIGLTSTETKQLLLLADIEPIDVAGQHWHKTVHN